jgi:hypothetical protein
MTRPQGLNDGFRVNIRTGTVIILYPVSYQKDLQSLLADVDCMSTERLVPTPQRQGLGLEEGYAEATRSRAARSLKISDLA